MAFLSDAFTDAQEHWSTYEKEAFAVAETFHKLTYLLACDAWLKVFMDYRYLLFAFNPLALEPSLGRHKVMSTFFRDIEHVPGELNTIADIQKR